jgi:hypothetical protein
MFIKRGRSGKVQEVLTQEELVRRRDREARMRGGAVDLSTIEFPAPKDDGKPHRPACMCVTCKEKNGRH